MDSNPSHPIPSPHVFISICVNKATLINKNKATLINKNKATLINTILNFTIVIQLTSSKKLIYMPQGEHSKSQTAD